MITESPDFFEKVNQILMFYAKIYKSSFFAGKDQYKLTHLKIKFRRISSTNNIFYRSPKIDFLHFRYDVSILILE